MLWHLIRPQLGINHGTRRELGVNLNSAACRCSRTAAVAKKGRVGTMSLLQSIVAKHKGLYLYSLHNIGCSIAERR